MCEPEDIAPLESRGNGAGLDRARSDESGRGEIYVKPFPSGEGKWQVSIDGGSWPDWSAEGDRLFFVNDGKLHEVGVTSDPGLRLSSPRVVIDEAPNQLLLGHSYGTPRGGDRFVAVQTVENEAKNEEETAPRHGIFVVQNWLAEFRD